MIDEHVILRLEKEASQLRKQLHIVDIERARVREEQLRQELIGYAYQFRSAVFNWCRLIRYTATVSFGAAKCGAELLALFVTT